MVRGFLWCTRLQATTEYPFAIPCPRRSQSKTERKSSLRDNGRAPVWHRSLLRDYKDSLISAGLLVFSGTLASPGGSSEGSASTPVRKPGSPVSAAPAETGPGGCLGGAGTERLAKWGRERNSRNTASDDASGDRSLNCCN